MKAGECWECGGTGEIQKHHPVPRSRGGSRTIFLCLECHAKAHHRKKNMSTSALVSAKMHMLKAQGRIFGNPGIMENCQPLGVAAIKESAKKFNAKILLLAADLRQAGYNTVDLLVDRLNGIGVKTRNGKAWTYHNLYRVLNAEGNEQESK